MCPDIPKDDSILIGLDIATCCTQGRKKAIDIRSIFFTVQQSQHQHKSCWGVPVNQDHLIPEDQVGGHAAPAVWVFQDRSMWSWCVSTRAWSVYTCFCSSSFFGCSNSSKVGLLSDPWGSGPATFSSGLLSAGIGWIPQICFCRDFSRGLLSEQGNAFLRSYDAALAVTTTGANCFWSSWCTSENFTLFAFGPCMSASQ